MNDFAVKKPRMAKLMNSGGENTQREHNILSMVEVARGARMMRKMGRGAAGVNGSQ